MLMLKGMNYKQKPIKLSLLMISFRYMLSILTKKWTLLISCSLEIKELLITIFLEIARYKFSFMRLHVRVKANFAVKASSIS